MIIRLVNVLFDVLWWLFIARFLLSWLPDVNRRHPAVVWLHRITDPIVRPFQGMLVFGMVDFAPVVVFFLLRLVQRLVNTLLFGVLRW
ncbi:MAG TPA: YggT family protein [Firmicutes bacterium]|nr:YggT family protein [Bacillota bacterium]